MSRKDYCGTPAEQAVPRPNKWNRRIGSTRDTIAFTESRKLLLVVSSLLSCIKLEIFWEGSLSGIGRWGAEKVKWLWYENKDLKLSAEICCTNTDWNVVVTIAWWYRHSRSHKLGYSVVSNPADSVSHNHNRSDFVLNVKFRLISYNLVHYSLFPDISPDISQLISSTV